MILQFSSALCVQPSTETVKQLPSFQIVFGGKIEWFDHSNLKAMICSILMKFGESDYLLRMGQKKLIFECVLFF